MRPTTRHIEQVMQRRGDGGSPLALVAVLIALIALMLALATGCSSEKRYKVLSFFFDGVPNPNAPAGANGAEGDEFAGGQQAGGAPKLLAIIHKPYAENKCNDCHDNASGRFDDFQKLDSSICLKCHDSLRTQYPVMHGPVAVGECNLCHVPHESTTPHLLRDDAPAVCTQCHQPELLSPTPREHLMPTKSCLDCHSGHGGTEHGLLKKAPDSTTRPTTVPTAAAVTAAAPAVPAAVAGRGDPP
jgi:predicted CXXCH cytochrome family protein